MQNTKRLCAHGFAVLSLIIVMFGVFIHIDQAALVITDNTTVVYLVFFR